MVWETIAMIGGGILAGAAAGYAGSGRCSRERNNTKQSDEVTFHAKGPDGIEIDIKAKLDDTLSAVITSGGIHASKGKGGGSSHHHTVSDHSRTPALDHGLDNNHIMVNYLSRVFLRALDVVMSGRRSSVDEATVESNLEAATPSTTTGMLGAGIGGEHKATPDDLQQVTVHVGGSYAKKYPELAMADHMWGGKEHTLEMGGVGAAAHSDA